MAIELGAAYLSIIPETSKIAPGIKKALGDNSGAGGQADKAGKSIGTRLTDSMGKAMKRGAIVAGGAVTGVLGLALKKGFSRLKGIEEAQAKLTGLGHSAKTVDKIMQNALGAVKGTAFGLDSAATVAASAVAAGVKPGQQLERTLKLVGDAATIAGVDMGEMGAIFNKVAAANKVQMDVINQLHDAGVPALSLLAKEMGVTAAEASKMASAGKIDFKTFQDAMEKGFGGAALESGKTVSGAFANMQAALGRLGASMLGGVFSKLPNMFGSITEKLDTLGPVAERVGKAIGSAVSTMAQNVGPALERVRAAVDPVVSALRDKLQPVAERVVDFFREHPEVLKGAAIGLGIFAAALGAVALALGVVSLAASPITLTILAVAALGAGLAYLWKNSDTFRSIVQKMWDALKAGGEWVKSTLVPTLVDLGKRVAENLAPVFTALGEFFTGTLVPVLQQVKQKFIEWMPTIQKVAGFVAKLVGGLVVFYTAVLGKVIPVVLQVAGFLLRKLVPAVLGAIEIVAKIIGKVIAFGGALIDGGKKVIEFGGKVGTAIADVIKLFLDLPTKVKGAVSGAASWLFSAGKDIVNGLISGAGSILKDLGKFFLDLVPGWIRGPFKKALGISSPSKEFKGYGKNIIQGLTRGIDTASGAVGKSIGKMLTVITDAVKKKNISQKLANEMRATVNGIAKEASKLRGMIARRNDLAKSIGDNLRGEWSLSEMLGKNEFGVSLGAGSAAAAARALANRMKAFASKLSGLVKAGLPAALVQEIAGYGSVEGSRLADAFLKSSKADIASLRASYADFNKYSNAAGMNAANAAYGPRIAAQQKTLENAVERGLSKARINVTVGVDKKTQARIYVGGKAEATKRK